MTMIDTLTSLRFIFALMVFGAHCYVIDDFLFYLCASEVPKVYRYSCYYWLPVSVVLLGFSLQKGIISRLLTNRLFVVGGEISYSFYLIHLFLILTYAGWQKETDGHIGWYLSVPLLFMATMLLSLLSYRYFEKPMNQQIKLLLNN